MEASEPSPAAARAAVTEAAEDAGLPAPQRDDLVLAVSEVVTNAHRHGTAPVRLAIQTSPGYLVVEVSDAGPGPSPPGEGAADPTLPPPEAVSGRGRWLVHHSDVEVVECVGQRGYTVRLVARSGR